MSEITLKFNLPEEDYDFRMAIDGHKYCGIINDVLNFIRQKLKYKHTFKTPDEALEAVRENIIENMDDENVGLGE